MSGIYVLPAGSQNIWKRGAYVPSLISPLLLASHRTTFLLLFFLLWPSASYLHHIKKYHKYLSVANNAKYYPNFWESCLGTVFVNKGISFWTWVTIKSNGWAAGDSECGYAYWQTLANSVTMSMISQTIGNKIKRKWVFSISISRVPSDPRAQKLKFEGQKYHLILKEFLNFLKTKNYKLFYNTFTLSILLLCSLCKEIHKYI